MAKSTAAIAAAWQKGMAGAGQAYTAGTAGTNKNPMALAAAQADKAAANYAASVSSGQWANALNAVPVSAWKAGCAAGASRLASGAAKGLQKYTTAIQALQPTYAAMKQAADANGGTPGSKAMAAIDVLVAAGKKGKAAGG